jgi:putative glutathione S-transferase
VTPRPLQLGGELAPDGSFRRQESRFVEVVTADGSSGFRAEPGRYHLYVSWACPWAHRTVIVRRLKRLEDVVGLSVVDPIRDERGWRFSGGEYVDAANGFSFLSEAYLRSDPAYDRRCSVPVLWDTHDGRIVCNDSAMIVRMLGRAWDAWGDATVDHYPLALRAEIDALATHVQETVNEGVYNIGFTTNQAVYERELHRLFATLDELETRLSDGRAFLFGDQPTEADWRLFPTLLRFDAVYYLNFKCSLRRIFDLPYLWAYTKRLYRWPGVAETVRLDEIRAHYYRTLPMVNPSGIVPLGPQVERELEAA